MRSSLSIIVVIFFFLLHNKKAEKFVVLRRNFKVSEINLAGWSVDLVWRMIWQPCWQKRVFWSSWRTDNSIYYNMDAMGQTVNEFASLFNGTKLIEFIESKMNPTYSRKDVKTYDRVLRWVTDWPECLCAKQTTKYFANHNKAWPRDYKTFFMLNSTKHVFFPGHKY